jgi:hypothetical protein
VPGQTRVLGAHHIVDARECSMESPFSVCGCVGRCSPPDHRLTHRLAGRSSSGASRMSHVDGLWRRAAIAARYGDGDGHVAVWGRLRWWRPWRRVLSADSGGTGVDMPAWRAEVGDRHGDLVGRCGGPTRDASRPPDLVSCVVSSRGWIARFTGGAQDRVDVVSGACRAVGGVRTARPTAG